MSQGLPDHTILSVKPAFHMLLDVKDPPKVFTQRAEGASLIADVTGGFTKSVSDEYPFNSTVSHGRDDILINPGGTHNNLDCTVFGTTEDGFGYKIHYGGVVVDTDASRAVLQAKSNGHGYTDAYITSSMSVSLSSDAPKKYDWIKFHTLIGRGRFFRDDKGLHIEYILHVAL